MRKLALVVGAALLLTPAALAAQVCFGYPATRGQSDLGGVIRLQSTLSQFGGTYGGHYANDVVADGLLTFDHYSEAGIKKDGFSAAARVGLALHSLALPPALSICPHAGLGLAHLSGQNELTIPVGIAIGTVVPLISGAPQRSLPGLAPAAASTGLLIFATPEVAYAHTTGHSDTFALAEIGARLLLGRFYLGASVIVKSGNRRDVLGLNAGIPLP